MLYARLEGAFAKQKRNKKTSKYELQIIINHVYIYLKKLYSIKKNKLKIILTCEHTFCIGSFFTYRKHRVLPNIQYLLAYKSTSTRLYTRNIYIFEKKEKNEGLFIVIVIQYLIPHRVKNWQFDEKEKTCFYLAILYSLPKSVTQVASLEKYYCASSNLKNITNIIKVRRYKAYFLCMLFLYASRKRTRLIKDKEHF